jgi:hypothetical protein
MKINILGEEVVRPRILLLDFDESDVQALTDLGYKVCSGRTGLKSDGLFLPMEHYRFDMVFYRCSYQRINENKIPEGEKVQLGSFCLHEGSGKVWYTFPRTDPSSKGGRAELELLRQSVLDKGGALICFLGDRRIKPDFYLTKKFLNLNENVTVISKDGGSEKEYELELNIRGDLGSIQDYLKNLLSGKLHYIPSSIKGIHKSSLDESLGNWEGVFEAKDENDYVFAHFLRNYAGNTAFLPDYASNNIRIIKDLLIYLKESCRTDIFNKIYDEQSWIENDAYMFSDEVRVIEKIKESDEEYKKTISDLEKERKEARVHTHDFRAILTNGDDNKVEEEEKLVPPIRRIFEWLGITVKDLDPLLIKQENALMNDLILEIDGQEVVCEVKGVTSGPKGEYVTQVQKHIIRYSKLTGKPVQPGLLVLNYQRDKDPISRSAFYTDAGTIEVAVSSQIGLLDTKELFRICKAIKGSSGELELKARLRNSLLTSGIILFK